MESLGKFFSIQQQTKELKNFQLESNTQIEALKQEN